MNLRQRMRRVYALAFARDLASHCPKMSPDTVAEDAVTLAVALDKALAAYERAESKEALKEAA